ncbi:PAF acetylhydrolase [Coniochaeta sp. 2T2.1]|nr:PAF acetylhydrolase [Coniochaeta sp. 2T2.1]
MRFLAALSALTAVAAVVLPGPNGPYGVSMVVKSLTDKSRIDPYAPMEKRQKRQVLVSLFLPVDTKTTPAKKGTVPYMTPAVAQHYDVLAASIGLPNNTFASFDIGTSDVIPEPRCRGCRGTNKALPKLPLVLLSPGSGQSRLLYGVMARSLASEGYAVVTVDHPYEAPIVEFPDGTIVKAADISDEDIPALEKMTQVCADDMSFVIDQLQHSKTFAADLCAHKTSINFQQIVMYGHSLGGATAAAAMLSDPRIKGGVDMDGRFFNPVLEKGLDRPFALLGRPDHRSEDETWPGFFSNLRGSRFEMQVAGAAHGSFTDFPVLIDSLNLPEGMKKAVAQVLGSASGETMDKVIRGVMVAFCDFVFGKSPAPALLQKGQIELPEMTVLQSDIRK